jgi:hypothetical protein
MRFEARAACGVVAIVFGTLGTACRNDEALNTSSAPVPQSVAAGAAQAPEQTPSAVVGFTLPPPAYRGELPPFPTSPYAPPRPPELIKAIYTFAARHPEVLHYVPCFCGCQRSGHSNNDDCFIQGREANGKPKWDPHGMT